jgi:hypothetical protein
MSAASSSRPLAARRARNSVPLLPEASKDAKRRAVVILEVWAGVRTPLQAAEVLGVSLPRYYQMEASGLQGLVAACTARPKGRQVNTTREVSNLQHDNERLRRELGRQQALIRLTQRSLGVAPPVSKPPATKGRRRKPVVRALTLATRLQPEAMESASEATAATATQEARNQG